MELQQLISRLGVPGAYPYAVDRVDVRHTHLSAVFLAGSFVYKVKKPVRLGFVDFSTRSLREHFCREEIRLNRRLAPQVYLGTVPIAKNGNDIKVEGTGEAIEWAVKMQRLPEHATLEQYLLRGEGKPRLMQSLGERIARFHAGSAGGPSVAAFGRFDVVAGNARENFDQLASHIGSAISQRVFDRLKALTEDRLSQLRSLIEERATRGIPRDTHGDLRLEHIYLFSDRVPPDDLVILDCIEFNERFRYADPVADMAFLVMDLKARGYRDLSDDFTDAYFRDSGDEEGRALLPFYVSYRAAVRAKVRALKSSETEVPPDECSEALMQARAHCLQALSELEAPAQRPCLILIGGLPGTGKSTLARVLAEQTQVRVIRSDVVRKELAGVADTAQDSKSSFGENIYTEEWNQRTYAECLHQVEQLLFEGERVLVDASFHERAKRQLFLQAAARWGMPLVILVCRAEPETARTRLESRRGDVSDADWVIYQRMTALWDELTDEERRVSHDITTDASQTDSVSQALSALRSAGVQ